MQNGESSLCFWVSDFYGGFAVPVVSCELGVSAVPGRVVLSCCTLIVVVVGSGILAFEE